VISANITGMAGARDHLRKLAGEGRAAAVRAVAELAAALKANRHPSTSAPSTAGQAGAGSVVRANKASDRAGSRALDDRVFGITTNRRKALEQAKQRFEPPKPREALAKGLRWHSEPLSEPAYLRSRSGDRLPDREAAVIGKLREAMRR
jgi:hypothetical protein